MNKIQVLGGGFPGTSKTWRFIRDMINEVHEVATAMGGENCIVKGCDVVNNVGSDGIVIIAGEALPFVGGAVQSHVEIVESVGQVQYFADEEGDGQADVKDAYFERYARFAAAGTPWSDLKRIDSLSEVSKRLPPKQSALPFWGAIADIPDGWQLCDGSNGTPDLRGMFVAGYDPADPDHNEVGKQGGSSKVVLKEEELAAHYHKGSTSYDGRHNHNYSAWPAASRGEAKSDGYWRVSYDPESRQTSYEGNHSHSITTTTVGQNKGHENRPKFYTMAWIAYVG